MSHAVSNRIRKPSVRRATSRQGKRAVGVSVLAFFAAIAVVGWFGLSGLETSDGEPTRTRQLIFAGGAPRLAVVEERTATEDETAASDEAEEDYVIGSFGEPMDDYYADDDGGGWGDAAMDRMSGFLSSSSGVEEARQRD
jgi:hypothetical protein